MTVFRCPFEKKGNEEGTIVTVQLTESREQNLPLLLQGFKDFHANTKLIALRCILPASVREGCESLDDLRMRILPYQADILESELEHRLFPFLCHQLREVSKEDFDTGIASKYFPMTLSESLMNRMRKDNGVFPESALEIADWIERTLRAGVEEGMNHPAILLFDSKLPLIPAFKIAIGGITVAIDRAYSQTDANQNRNCFHIVKAPLYPRPFGRWSREVEIVLSREADINALSAEERQSIRTRANAIHKKHGVQIESLADDKQPTGVWIPEQAKL